MKHNEVINWILDLDLEDYFYKNNLGALIGTEKFVYPGEKGPWNTSSVSGGDAFEPECPDLTRLHAIITKRKIINVLELGSGQSTKIMAHALKHNYELYFDKVSGIRRQEPFHLFSLESEQKYIEQVESSCREAGVLEYITLCFSEAEQTLFRDMICGRYKSLPSVCPDLIYIDGPMPISYKNGDKQYMNMDHSEVTNVTCDLMIIEPILLPGTIVIVDGMTNNARYIKRNLQRNWLTHEDLDADMTLLVLDEPPLGVHHNRQLLFQNS